MPPEQRSRPFRHAPTPSESSHGSPHPLLQVPLRQTPPFAHAVPSGLLAVNMQADGSQVVMPMAHSFSGWHGRLAVQDTTGWSATHPPARHTWPVPHAVPSGLLPVSRHEAAEFTLEQDVTPVLQGLVAAHTWSAMHGTMPPAELPQATWNIRHTAPTKNAQRYLM